MKFKSNISGGVITARKSASLILILSVIIIYSVYHRKNIKTFLIDFTFENPVSKLLHKNAQGKITIAPSQIDKYESLGSSYNKSAGNKKQHPSETLVYRKRRYLQFPEGSSFQLVFDLLVPIIDYTNYAILTITCALAFELPSKPLSELQDDLIQKLHKGSHGISRNDSVFDTKYIDTHSYQKHIKDKFSDVIYIHPSEYEYQNAKYNTNYMTGNNRLAYKQKKPIFYTNYIDRKELEFQNKYHGKFDTEKPSLQNWESSPYIRRNDVIPKRKEHAVYHIMGKRSVGKNKVSIDNSNPWLDKLDKIHLQYHRSSRHALYSKVEALLNKKGKNGTECILRALCETGSRKHETKPAGLLTEIFRAVFTLPPEDEEMPQKNYHFMHKARNEAHWNQKNCSQTYPLCEDFIWGSNFSF